VKMIRFLLCLALLISFVSVTFPAETREQKLAAALDAIAIDPSDSPERIVKNAVRRMSHGYIGQSEVLARIAWPTVDRDPRLAVEARRILVEYGDHAMLAMKNSLRRAGKEHSADIIKAMNEAFEWVPYGIPVDYMPAMLEALWNGSPEARLLAMKTMTRHGASGGLLQIIDSAIEYPSLVPTAIECLGTLGNEKARFYLDSVLRGDNPEHRKAAAWALGNIRGEAHAVLVDAMKSDDPEIRKTAALAIIPVAGPSELTAMHEYVYRYPEDDPETVEAVREAAERLEIAIEEFRKSQQTEEPGLGTSDNP